MNIFAGMTLVGQPDFGKAGGDQEFDGIRLHGERHRRAWLEPAGRMSLPFWEPHHLFGGILEAGGRGLCRPR